mmetsp:Transcript_14737/g.23039  ORF Transcript_14737/g.23039 Transcript_14737/m.23039 type:complete len:642 (-) Transcript_14737:88-2013(-)
MEQPQQQPHQQLVEPLLQTSASSEQPSHQEHQKKKDDSGSATHNDDGSTYVSFRDVATSLDSARNTEHPSTTSILSNSSFWIYFVTSNGPPQIIILCCLLALGFGCTVGVVPAVMTDRYARMYHGYNDTVHDCSSSFYDHADKPQACLDGSNDAQQTVTMANFISNGFTFCTSSFVGSLSDEYGRKRLFCLGIFVALWSPLALVLVQLFPQVHPLWYYVANAMSGLLNWIALALASLSDIIPSRWRAASFGLLLGGFFCGFAVSPMLALLLTHFWVSVLSLSVVTCGFISTIVLLPETLPPEVAASAAAERRRQRQQYEEEHVTDSHDTLPSTTTSSIAGDNSDNTTIATTTTRRTIATTKWQRRRRVLCRIATRPMRELSILNRNKLFRLLSALAFFSGMVTAGNQTLSLYYFEEHLGVNDHDVAIMFVMVGILGVLVQCVLMKTLNDWLGERYIICVAFFVGFIHNVMYGLATTKTTIYIAIALASVTGMSFPAISAIKANNVDESEQGRIQGALYSLQALASAVGPLLLRFVYSNTKDKPYPGPGCMFLFASLLYLVAVAVACALPKDQANSSSSSSAASSSLTSSCSRSSSDTKTDTSLETTASTLTTSTTHSSSLQSLLHVLEEEEAEDVEKNNVI